MGLQISWNTYFFLLSLNIATITPAPIAIREQSIINPKFGINFLSSIDWDSFLLLIDGLFFHEENAYNADDDPQDKEAQRQSLRAAWCWSAGNANPHNEQAG